ELDIPFTLFYLLDAEGKQAHLTACTGMSAETVASPVTVELKATQCPAWPLAEVALSGQTRHISDLETRFENLSCGPYPEALKEALALPITPPGCERPIGILVVGISSRLPLN